MKTENDWLRKDMPPTTTGEFAHSVTDECGSITTEYAVLLCLVAVGCSLATIGLGSSLVRLFMAQETWLMLAVP